MKSLRINKGFIMQTLDKKITIFDGDKSVLYTLNETASYIFRKIKNKETEENIVNSLVKKYGIKPDKAKKDIRDLLYDLVSKKIIVFEK